MMQSMSIHISSSEMERNNQDPNSSFSAQHLSFHIFEREIHENFGIVIQIIPGLNLFVFLLTELIR